MSKCVLRNKEFLKKLTDSNQTELNNLIQNATPDQIRVLSEISMNILSGNFPLKNKHRNKLSQYKTLIRQLSRRKTSHKTKKIILNQKGGFLPILIAPVLSALGAIAGKAISAQLGL